MNENYWALPTLATCIRWLEELIAILSKPFLMLGFIISMLDLLTQGKLLNIWLIYYGWAAIQAIAVDATFFVTWHRVKKSATSGHWFQFVGFTLLGIALGIVAWAAMDLQSLEQAVGISNTEALARLNLNPVLLTHLRSFVAVIMGAIVAMISPEDNKNTNIKKGKKWTIKFRAITLIWGIKIPFFQVVIPPQTETKIKQETAKNEPQKVLPITLVLNTENSVKPVSLVNDNGIPCERFEWPVGSLQLEEYQQDFTLIEHVKPEIIEPALSEINEPEIEEEKPQLNKEVNRRTMTIEEVIKTTGLTERKIKNLIAKRVLKVAARNHDLILISSLNEWQENNKETDEIPVAKNGHNGYFKHLELLSTEG